VALLMHGGFTLVKNAPRSSGCCEESELLDVMMSVPQNADMCRDSAVLAAVR